MNAPPPAFDRSIIRAPDPVAWADAGVLVVTACDSRYLGHAMALARSMEAFAGEHHLLVHLVNPGKEDLARVDLLARQLGSLRLHVSAERVRLPAGTSPATYYACARFLLAAELLASESAVPLLTLDADAICVGPLTLDFSDKPEAEICLRRRDLKAGHDVEEHLRVAAGAAWLRNTAAAAGFIRAVADDLVAAFVDGSAQWFVDQRILYRHVQEQTAGAQVRNLKTKFSDWKMSDSAVFWTGKGDRKYLDVRYLLLREAFDEDPARRETARMLNARVEALLPDARREQTERLRQALGKGRGLRTAVFLPRLDLPWKQSGLTLDGRAPAPAPDVVDLRLWWKRFAMELARALSDSRAEPRIVEIPAWEITPERVDAEGVELAFVPHRCDLDFGPTSTARRFYMQEYFRHVFVVDPHGWSAASSVYPVDAAALPPAVLGAWDHYEAAFRSGALASKFGQGSAASRDELRRTGQLPAGPFVFFPLQVPHDQSIRYFSPIEQEEALEAVHALAVAAGLNLVLKEHPANRGSMKPYRERYRGGPVTWSEANVHDILRHCAGVVTINSGVGFEALLAHKPVVCFGRSEYDCAVFSAEPDGLPAAWEAATGEAQEQRVARYARFVDWFMARHAVDLQRPVSSRYVLDRIVREAVADANARREGVP